MRPVLPAEEHREGREDTSRKITQATPNRTVRCLRSGVVTPVGSLRPSTLAVVDVDGVIFSAGEASPHSMDRFVALHDCMVGNHAGKS